MRVSRNQRHRALWSLLFSSVGRNFSSSKTKEQWLQERGGEFSSLEGRAPCCCGVHNCPPHSPGQVLPSNPPSVPELWHCPAAPQPGHGHWQWRYLLSSALLANSSAVMLARAAAGTCSASYSAGDRTGRILRKRTSLGSPFKVGQFCPHSLEEK